MQAAHFLMTTVWQDRLAHVHEANRELTEEEVGGQPRLGMLRVQTQPPVTGSAHDCHEASQPFSQVASALARP